VTLTIRRGTETIPIALSLEEASIWCILEATLPKSTFWWPPRGFNQWKSVRTFRVSRQDRSMWYVICGNLLSRARHHFVASSGAGLNSGVHSTKQTCKRFATVMWWWLVRQPIEASATRSRSIRTWMVNEQGALSWTKEF
jgi:hypothetical protein